MTIADDGCGFDINTVRLNGRLGLTNIQERAALMGARLDIESVLGAGTKIMIKVNR
jgi:signal transduction histidine kinase